VNPILLDRMYKIKTTGYQVKDKIVIAKQYLIPKIRYEVNFKEGDIIIPDTTLNYIIENYNYLPLNPLNKGRVCLVLFKHILKIIKQLSDSKNNWFGFTNWDSFRKCGKY
jgi:ATP-dependent Lon protease